MRWFAVFALLLLAITAVPLLTASSAEGSEEPPAEELPAPDFSEIEQEELEYAEWLLSPEAESQREASQTAYTALTAGEAQGLLLEAFPKQLKELNADPARFLSELEIEEALETYGARISTGEGESALVESAVPVESDLGGEGKEPVDLALEESGNDFVPQNPLTEVELPASAEEPIQLQSGVEVMLPASDNHDAEPLGDKNLFYPETDTATDTLVSPIAGGVEVFEQLRSPESPEQFSFALSLPAGASLQMSEEDGGAEIISSAEEKIAEVPAPSAVDAQGTEVPVTMSVEGHSLLLEVPHDSLEVAYPLLVDPAFLSDTPALTSSEWHTQASGSYAFAKGFSTNGAPYLAVWARNNENYGANTDGQWAYTAPGKTTFIEEATFGSIHFEGCQSQPHGYLALYNPSSKTFTGRGLYQVEGGSGGGSGGSWTAGGGGYGYRDAVMGVGTALKSVKTTCVMEMRIHGATMKENDPEAPTINSVSGVPASGVWFDSAKAGEATIVATDPGFGIEEIAITDGAVTNTKKQYCSGLSGNRCPPELTWKTPPPYVEGEHTLKVTAEDALGKTATWTRPTKVDTKAPDIYLDGQFAEATDEEGLKGEEQEASENKLRLSVYNLEIKATDGDEGDAAKRQSGVKNIEILLDGTKEDVPWEAQECTQPQSSCEMKETYQVKLVGLSAGEHKLKVIATDQVGLARDREIEFEYIPATGMSDEYVMQHFPLPDGEGDESEEEDPKRPELAVNVMNGNLVYRQRDVEVSGAAVNLELERFYNSQLPKAESTEWGDRWTLAQTPKLEPEVTKEKAPPQRGSMVRTSGTLARDVALPTEPNATQFDARLGATVTKEPNGGYEVADQSGRTANSLAFDEAGKVTELRTPGYAKVEYGYENGDLSEVAVRDPASRRAVAPTEETKKAEKFEAPAYSGTFGGEGSGAGRLSAPAGIATDPEGNIWVADTHHDRIQKFDSTGEFVDQFGATGKGGGLFREPHGVAVDAKGNIWVADTGNYRVQELSPKGKLIRQFGTPGVGNPQFTSLLDLAIDPEGNVWTVDAAPGGTPRVREFSAEGTYITKFGVKGSADGQFKEPKGIAVDSKGSIWLADTANNRIEAFNSKGEYISKFGSEGTGNGQLKSPAGLSFDSEGNIWVADSGNNRIEEFSAEGTYMSQFGTAGNGAGQFSEPRSVVVDSKGNAWIADTGNDRVQEYAAGEFVRKFGGEGSEAGQLSAPKGIATDSKGNAWVADTGHNRIQEFDASGKVIGQFGAKGSADGLFLEPHGIAIDAEDNVWIADTGNFRVQELNSKGEFIRKFGSKGGTNGNFYSVWDVAIDPEGHAWTIDASETTSRAQEFSSKGEYIRKFGSYATTFMNPRGIATDSKGNVWVSDSSGHKIKEFSAEGKLIRAVGEEGTGNGQFWMPEGITVDAEDNVWVDDPGNNRIEEFSAEGSYLSQFGTPGNNDGEVSEPRGIAADAKGNLWVADTGNDRVQEYAASEFVRKFGGGGSGAGQLKHPTGIATDSEGNVWVADTWHNRVQKFSPKGEFLFQFGASAPGDGNFYTPHAVAVDSKDNIWVADNDKVQEFNSQGEFIRRLSEAGECGYVEDLAVGPEGHLWAVRSGAGKPCVQEFTGDGEFLSQFGSEGSEDGQLKGPEGIAIDSEGNIWIADTDNWRVKEFSAKGEFIRKFGSSGTENSAFWYPKSLAADPEGNIWVADRDGDRVQEFSPKGTSLGQFGTAGNSDGQFSEPQGVTLGAEGSIWVADSGNNRLEEWQIPRFALKHSSIYVSSLADSGGGGGELEHPGDVALGAGGSLWVADESNNRIEEFDDEGEFVKAFGKDVNLTAVEAAGSEAEKNLCTAASGDTCQAGTAGSANGALHRPASLALDAEGDIWVADAGNSRIEELDPDGKYLSKFGSNGGGEGQLQAPEGIAIDPHGNIWVSDTYNGRVQEFDEAGELIKVVGSYGAGPGQMGEPTGIDIGPWGNIWIADWENNRVEEFSEKGKFIRQFGTEGTANGQFERPDGIAVDDRGEVWVADEGNNQVQAFTEAGEYVAQFGAEGSEEGQFDFGYPIGLATDSNGNLWIADSNNNRVQQWGVYNYIPADESATVEDTPEVEVNESGGLVTSVEGDEVGQISYEHDGEMLTSVDSPKGETAYEYDEAERLTKVTLPNGTWGAVAYDSIGRVKSVTVSIEGKEKTTHFGYTDEPRRTVVEPEGEPTVTYDIGANGSVLKWWDAPSVPTIEEMEGSLYAQRVGVNPEETISPGDQTLVVPAYDIHGVASIQLIANGNQLITEKTCKQDYEVEGTECMHEELSWVTETEDWPPGILQLEVIATNSEGNTASERFSDNVPYTPPPDPEVPEPPRFKDVLNFREEYGLDLDLKGNEQAINERIFQLIADWHDPSTPAGEVARASFERWSAPMRPVDVAELEYREQYLAHDIPRIEEWGETQLSEEYAGVYVDHPSGGLMRVGFTTGPDASIALMKQQLSLMAPNKIASFATPPLYSLATLQVANEDIESSRSTFPPDLLASTSLNIAANRVILGVTNLDEGAVQVANIFGPGDMPFSLALETEPSQELAQWEKNKGPVLAGDSIFSSKAGCSAGYGAFERSPSGAKQFYLVTAGHCANLNETVKRRNVNGVSQALGKVIRYARAPAFTSWVADAEAIFVSHPAFAPQKINLGIYGAGTVKHVAVMPPPGRVRLCHSGAAIQGAFCGRIVRELVVEAKKNSGHMERITCFAALAQHGDSGGPVWIEGTHTAVGIAVQGRNYKGFFLETCAVALKPRALFPSDSAVLTNPAFADIHIRSYEP